MIPSVILGASVVLLVYIYFVWNNSYWTKRGLPHVRPSLFVGNTPNGFTQKRNAYYDVQDVFNKFRGQFQFVGFYSFRKPTVLILDPAIVRRVFLTDFHTFAHNDFGDVVDKNIDPILGYNPSFLNGDEWKERRSDITPAFTLSRIRALYPLIEAVSTNLGSYIDKELRMGTVCFDARELSAKYTTDVISSCIFALDAGSLKDKDAVIRKMAKEMFKPSLRTFFLFMIAEMCPSLNQLLRIKMIPSHVEIFFRELMKEASRMRREGTDTDKADIMQYLLALQDKKQLNDTELMANAITFFLDGFETSSISMAFILLELSRNKRVQDKLRREIEDAEEEGPLTMDSIAEMQYMDLVIYEALRLNPVVSALAKKSLSDCEMALTEDAESLFRIPAQTTIIIPVLDIHRDSRNYEDPLEFIPERFDKENGGVKAFRDRGAYLAFGMGPRVCLGQRFALTQIKSALVDILKAFEMTCNEKTQIPLVMDPKEFLNLPQGGIWINFKRLSEMPDASLSKQEKS